MSIKLSWFPGHMKKTLDHLAGEEKKASMAVVMLDSRCPLSTRNPKLEAIFKNKPILYVLNKEELSDEETTNRWLKKFKKDGMNIITLSCKTGSGRKIFVSAIKKCKNDFEKKRGNRITLNLFKIVVIGLPNTGKSSIINLLSAEKTVKTGKKPGLTRGPQWLKIEEDIEVLDTPGVMPPRMDLEDSPWILGSIAAIRQDVLPLEEVAKKLLEFMINNNKMPKEIHEGEPPENLSEILEKLALARGFLIKGGEPDIEKAALHLLKIFREGKLGRISLEEP